MSLWLNLKLRIDNACSIDDLLSRKYLLQFLDEIKSNTITLFLHFFKMAFNQSNLNTKLKTPINEFLLCIMMVHLENRKATYFETKLGLVTKVMFKASLQWSTMERNVLKSLDEYLMTRSQYISYISSSHTFIMRTKSHMKTSWVWPNLDKLWTNSSDGIM